MEMTGNRKIAKNTIMLYFRMILNMIVSLYTGRVVLQVLGVEDFGIYNIVGGIVIMFSFINNFLNTACERFISVAIVSGSKDEPKKIFETSLFIHIMIVILFFLASETIGLWFFCNKIVVPESRFNAALWVYHIFVINTCLTIFRVPYNATIIAEEKMDFYAYTSIGESIFRLLSVFLLTVICYDKLITYALLHSIIAMFMLLWYDIYVNKHFDYCSFSLRYEKNTLKKMTSFSGWNLFGSIADVGYKHGTNIILNLFCGVAYNAAMGLALTVRSTLYNFISNFQLASNPQIIKLFSLNDYENYRALVYRISKFSYFLMLIIAVPFLLNIDYILEIWLVNVPNHTASFVVLGLLYCLIDCLHGPLWVSMVSTGEIRSYQLATSLLLLLNLPLSYIALFLHFHPEIIIEIQIAVSIITLVIRLYYSWKYAFLKISKYIYSVIIPICVVTIVSVPFVLYTASLFEKSFFKLLVTSSAFYLLFLPVSYFGGLTANERTYVKTLVRNKIPNII